MTKKGYQYWGVYETGVTATPKGAKKIVEEMAGMLSDGARGGTGRKVCIQKAQRGFGTLGEATGVCYVNGVREIKRKARKPRTPKVRPVVVAAPALAGADTPPKASEEE